MKFARLLAVLLMTSLSLAGCGDDRSTPADGGGDGGVDGGGDGGADGGADGGDDGGDGGAPCGDGVIDGTEACDDGNNDSDDGCSDTCAVESGFSCTGEPSTCAPVCGDGVLAGMEACDDANTDPDDGCSDTCAVESGFSCTGEPSTCASVCGDGLVIDAEECDDMNTDALDGCSDTCTVEAGVTCDGEPSVCTATCGDGVVATIEACDDTNTDVDDGCSDVCEVERGWSCMGEPSTCMTGCGDGIVAGTETCDDMNMADDDGCSMACGIETGYACTGEPSACAAVCGDGIVAGGEECDDMNMAATDGCSDVCAVETGFICTGEPSVCDTVCGDGVVATGEACDDGNIAQADGCDHACAPELGFGCAGSPSVCTQGETVAEVALGGFGGCIRTTSGIVGCFGDNTEGEVGNNTDDVETFLPADTGIADATLVVAGDEHHCALRAGGTVWCWGDNLNLQQGVAGTAMDQLVPQAIPSLSGITALAAGDDHNCVIDAAGAVSCWGDNDNRQLGQGTSTTDSAVPLAVALPAGRTAISLGLGGDHSCAVLDNATLACWGDDDNGQLGDGTAGIDAGAATVVPGLVGVAQVDAGTNNTCARTNTGAVSCWGDNLDGQVADGTTTDRATPNLVTLPAAAADITVGADFACALLVNDQVWCWGESTDYETGGGSNIDQHAPIQVRGLTGVTPTDVEAGARGVCVVTSTGARLCWGYSEEGQLGVAPLNQLSLTAPLSFAGGTPAQLALAPAEYRGQMCGVFASGTPECAGMGNTVSTSTTTGAVGVFPGFAEHLQTLTPIPLIAGMTEGALGDGFACGRTATGVFCVGDNSNRQLGQGGTGTTDSAVALPVMGLGAVDEVAVGDQFACVRTGGTVQCWGDNDNLQSGEGSTTTDQSLPVTVAGLTDATDIELGENHGCAIRTGGGVSCWGDNGTGQLGTGTAGADSAVPVAVTGLPAAAVTDLAVGQDHGCALAGTEVWCWGENGRGQLGQGTTADSATPLLVLTDASGISAGFNFTCAIRTGGTVSCWGYGQDGHFGNGGIDVTGADDFLTPVDFVGATGVTAIETGNAVTCLDTAMGWQCAGFRSAGQLGNGTTLRPTRAYRAMSL